MKRLIFIFLIFIGIFSQFTAADNQNDIFAEFIGKEIIMDNTMITKLRASSQHNKKIFVDSDNDGKIDTYYFIDRDPRHGDTRQPLLVKVVDEDGDMHETMEGDLDSDLYIADWYGDGTIDRAVDYVDLDHDGDVDEQYLYQWTDNEHLLKRMPVQNVDRAYMVAWAKDYGDDNRLWYHTNYEYGQRITQWRTDFNGDEMFVYLFFFNPADKTLTPMWENAFSFYDLDGDTLSEEVVRFTGTGASTENLRYSMDIDNDSQGENRHDFDFSLSCIGHVDFSLDNCRTVTIRGHETEPFVQWEKMREVAKSGAWEKIHLTWDENDNNVDPVEGRFHNERWEGVINYGNDYMEQIGGPSCGPVNKRNEVDSDASGKMQMYYSGHDKRLHLLGAEIGWIDVDYDYDSIIDMKISMSDEDSDGFFDTWQYDIDADGVADRVVTTESDNRTIYPFDYKKLHEKYAAILFNSYDDNTRIIKLLESILTKTEDSFAVSKIKDYYETSLANFNTEFGLGRKIKNSAEGSRYYSDLIRESYWNRFLHSDLSEHALFSRLNSAYNNGKTEQVIQLLESINKNL